MRKRNRFNFPDGQSQHLPIKFKWNLNFNYGQWILITVLLRKHSAIYRGGRGFQKTAAERESWGYGLRMRNKIADFYTFLYIDSITVYAIVLLRSNIRPVKATNCHHGWAPVLGLRTVPEYLIKHYPLIIIMIYYIKHVLK